MNSPTLEDVRLVLFFTAGTSLKHWHDEGILERELALYRELRSHLAGVELVTYGNWRDLRYSDFLGDIAVRCNALGMPYRVFRAVMAGYFPLSWPPRTIVKSNQVQGADVALEVARRRGLPFVARCGYLLSDFMERERGTDSDAADAARRLERTVFTGADRVVVTTTAMRDRVASDYGVEPGRIAVFPNYVDTRVFSPRAPAAGGRPRVCFVARLAEQKDPLMLIEAMHGLDAELVIVGDGPLRERMERDARDGGVAVRFIGRVANAELPAILSDCHVFVLPSRYEGHPKALFEAMACGIPVVGTAVPGIREAIIHEETGLLVDRSAPALRNAIQRLLVDADLRRRLGESGRRHVAETISLDRIAARELELYRELLEERRQ